MISRIGRGGSGFSGLWSCAAPARAWRAGLGFGKPGSAHLAGWWQGLPHWRAATAFPNLAGLRRCSARARAGLGLGEPGSTQFAGWRQDCRIGAQRRLSQVCGLPPQRAVAGGRTVGARLMLLLVWAFGVADEV